MKFSSKSEDLLSALLWGLSVLARPSLRNLTQSFEAWDYENRLRPQLRRLERARLVERRVVRGTRAYRLTERGRLTVLGGIDPVQRWGRFWDGQWRLVLFDLPARNGPLRLRLWRWLRAHRYGYMQQSVWLTPDPVNAATFPLKEIKLVPESFIVIEGQPAATDAHCDIVQSAWDFPAINRRYQAYLELMVRGRQLIQRSDTPTQLGKWLTEQRLAWWNAISFDPLLPQPLLPSGYLGQDAWRQRQSTLDRVMKQLFQKLGGRCRRHPRHRQTPGVRVPTRNRRGKRGIVGRLPDSPRVPGCRCCKPAFRPV